MSEHMGDTNPHKTAKADAKAAQAYAKATRPWYKKKRWWAAGLVLIAIIGGAMGGGGDTDTDTTAKDDSSSQSNETDKKEAASSDEKKAEPTEEAKEPAPKAMKVQATAILKEFEGNEAAADIKYKGKTLQVTGQVAKVDTEMFDGDQYVIQVNGGGDYEFTSVNCNDQAADDVAKIQIGQQITVVGEFDDGGDLGVELKDCKIA